MCAVQRHPKTIILISICHNIGSVLKHGAVLPHEEMKIATVTVVSFAYLILLLKNSRRELISGRSNLCLSQWSISFRCKRNIKNSMDIIECKIKHTPFQLSFIFFIRRSESGSEILQICQLSVLLHNSV